MLLLGNYEAPALLRIQKGESMKKRNSSSAEKEADIELKPEYDFDYSKSRSNPYADRSREWSQRVVLLDPDLAKVFTDSNAVNTALRALLTALPSAAKATSKTRRPAARASATKK